MDSARTPRSLRTLPFLQNAERSISECPNPLIIRRRPTWAPAGEGRCARHAQDARQEENLYGPVDLRLAVGDGQMISQYLAILFREAASDI